MAGEPRRFAGSQERRRTASPVEIWATSLPCAIGNRVFWSPIGLADTVVPSFSEVLTERTSVIAPAGTMNGDCVVSSTWLVKSCFR